MRMQVVPSLTQWVKDLALMRCKSQTRLRSRVAVFVDVAEDENRSSNWIPSLGTYICHTFGPKNKKKKKKKE